MVAIVSAVIGPQFAVAATLPKIRYIEPAKPIGKPAVIRIPAIGVNTNIDVIGADSRGILGLPKVYENVAWYRGSARPGKVGNALMWGHLDSVSGPSTLWNLKRLKPGDLITVRDENGNTFKYKVTKSRVYAFNKVPIDDLLGPTSRSRLNIFTCAGTYSRAKHNYSHRIVVYSELVK